jgi:hypothetical protein
MQYALSGVCALAAVLTAPSLARADPPPTPPGQVMVHMDSFRPVQLARRVRDSDSVPEQWVVACSLPCDATLPADATYRVETAEGEPLAPPFVLEADAHGHTTIHVSHAHHTVAAGEASVGFGLPVLVTGLAGVYLEETFCIALLTDSCTPHPDPTAVASLAGIAVAGAALVVTGIVLLVESRGVLVSQATGTAVPPLAQTVPPPGAAAAVVAPTEGRTATPVVVWTAHF